MLNDLKRLNDKAQLKHSVNLIFKDNSLGVNQIMDNRTRQLIKFYKARELQSITRLDYHILIETFSILKDTEPKLF